MTDTQNGIAPETVVNSYIREIARTIAYEEWPRATPDERAEWVNKHWDDQNYLRAAKAVAALQRQPAQSPDWSSLHCRFDRCSGAVVGIYHIPGGCTCWHDPIQALCGQHIITAESSGPITAIIERFAAQSEQYLSHTPSSDECQELIQFLRDRGIYTCDSGRQYTLKEQVVFALNGLSGSGLPVQSPQRSELQEWIDNYPGDPEALRDALAEIEPTQSPLSQGGVLQDDLRELLLLLGMGDHARPQSPHEVFQECLVELRRRLGPARGSPAVADLASADKIVETLLPHEVPERSVRRKIAGIMEGFRDMHISALHPAMPAPAQGVTVTDEMVDAAMQELPPGTARSQAFHSIRAALQAARHPAEKRL